MATGLIAEASQLRKTVRERRRLASEYTAASDAAIAPKLADPIDVTLARKSAREMGVAEQGPALGTQAPTLDSMFPGG